MFDSDPPPSQRHDEVGTFFSSDMSSMQFQTHLSQGEFDLVFPHASSFP
jgi:hypothetical protein